MRLAIYSNLSICPLEKNHFYQFVIAYLPEEYMFVLSLVGFLFSCKLNVDFRRNFGVSYENSKIFSQNSLFNGTHTHMHTHKKKMIALKINELII